MFDGVGAGGVASVDLGNDVTSLGLSATMVMPGSEGVVAGGVLYLIASGKAYPFAEALWQ